ncbi:hypothetical protein QYE76_000052, partial [Lolium multiflorum]
MEATVTRLKVATEAGVERDDEGPERPRHSLELLLVLDASIKRTSIARGEEQLDMKTGRQDGREGGTCGGHEDISHGPCERQSIAREKAVRPENKNSADIITWREYEALRNEMRREFRTNDDELKSTVDEIKQTLDATNVTVTGLSDQMTDIQRNIADMRLAIENLTVLQQQQQEDEDPLKMTHTMLVVHLVVIVLVAGFHLAAMVVDKMKKMDW